MLSLAALRLLRNLAFAPDAKTHLLANPAVLPGLLAHAERVGSSGAGGAEGQGGGGGRAGGAASGSSAAVAAAYATSAVWALIYHGEKVGALHIKTIAA